MIFESFDVVFYTCIFLLPGFIIKSILEAMIPTRRYSDTRYFFTCLLYSVINLAIWSWAYIWTAKTIDRHSVLYWIVLLLITGIGATVVAFLMGIIKQKKILDKIFSKIRINKINSIPSAWDYYFSQQAPSWIIVTLKSGKTVYGLFSSHSYASSDLDERDLYIEKTYTVNENMEWIEDKKSGGILISMSEIETVEFIL